MTKFRLGDFEFVSLSRALSRPVQSIEREVRPGANGVTLWRTGKRGQPFVLMSFVDCTDTEAALNLLAQYEQLVGGDPVTAKWAGHEIAELLVFVHQVLPDEQGLRATLLGIGGKEGTSHAFLRCHWLVETIDPFSASPSD
jgi:hypothetical protein